MPTDGPTAKFLYSIIKQLDLKSVSVSDFARLLLIVQIDWNLVASQLEISNGHAARMRYSRFKQQMEGTTSTPRGSRAKKNAKGEKGANAKGEMKQDATHPTLKLEPDVMVKQEHGMYPSHQPMMKNDPYGGNIPNLADIPLASQSMMSAHSVPPPMGPYSSMTVAPVDLTMQSSLPQFLPPSASFERHPSTRHAWTPVKAEQEEAGELGDVLVKVERPENR